MNADSWVGKLYQGLQVVYTCAGLNVLFLLGTIMGLGVFGLAPSLLTTFYLAKLYHRHELVHPVKEFFHFYKKNFWTANKMLLPIFVIIGFTVLDGQLFKDSRAILIFLVVVDVVLALIAMYATSLWQYYDLTPKQSLQKGFQFIFYNVLGSVLTLLFSGIVFYGSYLLPGLIPFFSIGFWCVVVMGIHMRLYDVNEKKLQKGDEENDTQVVDGSADNNASHHIWPTVEQRKSEQR